MCAQDAAATVRAMNRLWQALACAFVLLALTAAPALATADRADYAAQANPICAAGNAESERVISDFQRHFKKLGKDERQQLVKPGNSSLDKFDRLFLALSRKLITIEATVLFQLQQVAPAAGDEGLVTSWLGVWQQQLALSRQLTRLEVKALRAFNAFFGKNYEQAEKRLDRIEARMRRIYKRYYNLSEVDLELGTQLGATYCVTGATGGAGGSDVISIG
jgi:hypothetical protein